MSNLLNYTAEAKISQGPWTSLVKGRSLGALNREFDPIIAEHVQDILAALSQDISYDCQYLRFSSQLTTFVLDYCNPAHLLFRRSELNPRVVEITQTLSTIDDLSTRVHAASILLECIGKLGLD